ncbi:hypothetical protein PZH32_07590 [Adlercreutzia equolifaciens]|uniref:hypothetical protein n=1 Tax=Adlercreutzia equolifaciens TaxID=446660 RepID=UPI0023B0774A|nr:hypothetical protein [Adlercreutzia equolifaciens]MDE8702827.1 hypothetical protein [Adlercreutzia equolifaciens]
MQLNDRLRINESFPFVASQIVNRLSELRAAKCLGDIPTCPPPKLKRLGEGVNRWSVSLNSKYSFIVEAAANSQGALLEEKDVVSLRILNIEKRRMG